MRRRRRCHSLLAALASVVAAGAQRPAVTDSPLTQLTYSPQVPFVGAAREDGDWDALNRLLSVVSIHIPDVEPPGTSVGICTMHYTVTEIYCPTFGPDGPPGDPSIFHVHPPLGLFNANVTAGAPDPAGRLQTMQLHTNTVHFDCRGTAHVSCGFFSATVHFHGWTPNGEIFVEADFHADPNDPKKNFSWYPPTTIDSPHGRAGCYANVNLGIDITGGLPGWLVDKFKSTFRGALSDAIAGAICDKLQGPSHGLIHNDLVKLLNELNGYIVPTLPGSGRPENVPHPLSGEAALQSMPHPRLVDFGDDNAVEVCVDVSLASGCVGILGTGRTELQKYLREPGGDPGWDKFVKDHSGPGFAGTGGHLFGHDQSFNATMDWTPINTTDPMSNVEVTILNVTFLHLGGFSAVELLQDAVEQGQVGAHTLRHTFTIPTIDVEVWTKIRMTPTNETDPIIISKTEIIEITRGRSTLTDVTVDVSTLLAVDYDRLMTVRLGQLYDDSAPCILQTIFSPGFNISSLWVTIGDFSSPVVDHFICRGIEQVVTKLLDAMFIMYRGPVVLAAPRLAQSDIRWALNNALHKWLQRSGTTSCPAVKPPPQTYADFTKNELFRSMASSVSDWLQDNDPGSLIDNATVKHSGVPGAALLQDWNGSFHHHLGQQNVWLAVDLKTAEIGIAGFSQVSGVRLIEACPGPPPTPPPTATPTWNITAAPHAATAAPTAAPSAWHCPTLGPYELYNEATFAAAPRQQAGTALGGPQCAEPRPVFPNATSCRHACDWGLPCAGWNFDERTGECCLLQCTELGCRESIKPSPAANTTSGVKPLVFRGGVSIDIDSSAGVSMHDDINFTLSMQGARAVVQPFLQVAEAKLRALSVGQLRDSECLFSTLETGGLTDLDITFQSIELEISHNCRNCSKAHREYMAELIRRAAEPRAIRELTSAINMVVKKIGGILLGADTARQLQKRIATAGQACSGDLDGAISNWMPGADIPGGDARCRVVNYTNAHLCQSACSLDLHCLAWTFHNYTTSEDGPLYQCCQKDHVYGVVKANNTISGVKPVPVHSATKMPDWLVALIASIGSALLLGAIIFLVWRCNRDRPMEVEQEWLMEGELGSAKGDDPIEELEQCCLTLRRRLGRCLYGDGDSSPLPAVPRPPPLFRDRNLPLLLRIVMPFLLAGTLVLFASSHVAISAAVDFEIQFAGDALVLHEFTSFSILHSVSEMFGAGAIPLAMLVLCFSIIWPYTKVFILILAWFVTMPLGRRGGMLGVLDTLGKWSFIDVYVLVLSLIAFNLDIWSPYEIEYLLGGHSFYAVRSRVRPLWGLYAFIFGVLSSLILNLIITFAHRHAADCSPLPQRSRNTQPYRLGGPCLQQLALFVLSAASIGLVAGAACVSTFTFTVQGLAGIAMDAGKEGGAQNSYSLLDIVSTMFDQADEGGKTDPMGMRFIAVIYLVISLVVPILHVAVLGVGYALGVLRLIRAEGKRAVLALHDVTSAFSALPVYFVAIVVSLLEIGQVSDFMVGSACDGLKPTFSDFLVPYGFILQSDATCFHISARLDAGVGLLLAAIVVKWFTCRAIVHQIHADLDNPDPMWDEAESAKRLEDAAGGSKPFPSSRSDDRHLQLGDLGAAKFPDAAPLGGAQGNGWHQAPCGPAPSAPPMPSQQPMKTTEYFF